MNTQNVPAKLRKLPFAAGIALGLLAAAASVIVAAPRASASTRFADHGGRVLAAARIYPTYWGQYWAAGAWPTADQITRALRTALAGSYLAGLAQYRDIGPVVFHGSRLITTTDPRSGFTDRDIEAFLNALFDAGLLPAPDDKALYVVTVPPGILSSYGTSRYGEHYYYQRGGHRIHYAWTANSGTLDGATQIATHEVVEALTDPEGTAIVGRTGTCTEPGWCEIADICSDTAKLNSVLVAPYWSNIAGRCVIPAAAALGTAEHRSSKLAAPQSRPLLAAPPDGVSARLETPAKPDNRAAATRRARKRRPTRHLTTGRSVATNLAPARALHGMWPSSRRATSAAPSHQS